MHPTSRRLTEVLARWLAGSLLVAVALHQLWLADHASLSPWSGGGFGMFSSIDSPRHRHLHAIVENEFVLREVRIPPKWEEEVLRATTLPSHARLAALAREIAVIESQDNIDWDKVTIEVWAIDYDAETLLPSGRLLRRERFEVAAQ